MRQAAQDRKGSGAAGARCSPPRLQGFWRQWSASNHQPTVNHYSSFNDNVALVTGAGSGMGLATAQAFAEAGASVMLADLKEEAVRKGAERLVSEGHRALAIACDVSNDMQVEAMVERTVAEASPRRLLQWCIGCAVRGRATWSGTPGRRRWIERLTSITGKAQKRPHEATHDRIAPVVLVAALRNAPAPVNTA